MSIIDSAFIIRYFKILHTATFDQTFAYSLGMPVRGVETAFMTLTTFTIVAAFNVSGSILVVALMVCPAATALLISRDIYKIFPLTIGCAGLSALIGFTVA